MYVSKGESGLNNILSYTVGTHSASRARLSDGPQDGTQTLAINYIRGGGGGGGGCVCVSKNVRRRRYGDESSGKKLCFLDDQLAYTVLHQQSFSRFLYTMNKGVFLPFPG